ncbi:GSCOCG00010388001-RA-CDS [Cotesia congregata]|nr:GSCOCG00010388001-RA-CDS [Cotesia congregata]
MREMAGKARVAINATWGLIQRIARSTFRDRMYLYNSLVRAGAMFGVELWGWEDNKEMEAVYGRYCKAALGLAKNTPEYIWRTESGAESWKVSCRRRASKYIMDILGMENGRWPKVCLRETCRGILNSKPSKWGGGQDLSRH